MLWGMVEIFYEEITIFLKDNSFREHTAKLVEIINLYVRM